MTRDEIANPSREANFSGANGDMEMFIFLVQLTPSSGNLTRSILLLLYLMVIHTYIHNTRRNRHNITMFKGD